MTSADPSSLRKAINDVYQRTLAGVPDDFGRLICVASTRDYNTGQYHHAGLEMQFSESIAAGALAHCHQEIFRRLSQAPVEDLVSQLQNYVQSTGEPAEEVLESWMDLQPYRVIVPADCEKLLTELFFSNIKIALAILRARRDRSHEGPQCASPRPSLDR